MATGGGRFRVAGNRMVVGTIFRGNHLRAAPSGWHDNLWESRMRLILGIIIGGALTIGGAYVADKTAGTQPMVNWDVVGKNVSNLTGMARDGWKKITG